MFSIYQQGWGYEQILFSKKQNSGSIKLKLDLTLCKTILKIHYSRDRSLFTGGDFEGGLILGSKY